MTKANQRTSVTLSSPTTGTVSTNERHACATPIRFCDNAAPYETAGARLEGGRDKRWLRRYVLIDDSPATVKARYGIRETSIRPLFY